MHRNSVIYRIARIREQLNIDFGDPDARLRLLISFKILEMADRTIFQDDGETGRGSREDSEG